MLFKMMMDHSADHERPIVRGLLKHILVGFGVGLLVGTVLFVLLLQSLGNLDLGMNLIWIGAMLLQCGPVGGLIGAGVFLSRITERDQPEDRDGGNAAPETALIEETLVTSAAPARRLRPGKPVTAA